ncbi:MAG: GlcG/HbpS family heme-binding protein [Candidatus Binataceae bacterium]|jgi:uncharacterized protein GlcG (DUF336 family)
MRELKLEEVRKLLEASGREAQRSGKPSTTAIVDFGGHLRGLERPEGGRIANVDIAIKKAWTAIAFKRPTAMVRAVMMPDAMGYGLQHTDARICMVAGGLPIVENGEFLGAVGVSGGSIDEDIACCLEALKACNFATEFADPLKASR